jgi:hypothetical protein
MRLITRPITWPSWKFGVLKLSMISFGVLMGAYFRDAVLPWQTALWVLFVITALVTTIWALPALFSESKKTPAHG